MRVKLFYVIVVLTLLAAGALAVWGSRHVLSQSQAMTGFALVAVLWIALNIAAGRTGFWLRAATAILLLVSSMIWLIPALQAHGLQ
jgi:hypothetical protein